MSRYYDIKMFYGIPLVKKSFPTNLYKILNKLENQSYDAPNIGFHYVYQSCDATYFFGVNLNYEIDEFDGHFDLESANHAFKEKHKEKYELLFNALSPSIRKELKTYGEPKVFFTWQDLER